MTETVSSSMSGMVKTPDTDPAEVFRYAALASSWWDLRGPFWPLHRLNRLRTSYLTDVFARHFGRDDRSPQPLAGLHPLDIGCGSGIVSESMARLGARVHGAVITDPTAIASILAHLARREACAPPVTA